MTADPPSDRAFDHTDIEPKWQRTWQDADVYRISDTASDPEYVLAMFPYTSGELHMGHVRNYTITDSYARFERLRGNDVLHPMGWDSFGLPAENAAEERDTNPRDWTMSCIDSMREQMRAMGFGYDWDREVTTCEPDYYEWNQWLFLRFMDEGLVERQETDLNWCPSCETVLADEQVEGDDEQCWRCDTPIQNRRMDQWFFTITDYADELLADLDQLDGWPTNIREMQRNWIGRQEGTALSFDLTTGDEVEIFTTRLDTIHGATFFAVSPGHPVAQSLAAEDEAVADYIDHVESTDDEAIDETSGVFTGEYAVNPATGEEIPVYVADYVLEDVGTGALFAVPAHDDRDHAFAEEHDIEIRQVVEPTADAETDPADVDVQETAYTPDGVLVNSGEFDGLDSETARERFVAEFDAEWRTEYRLRDWAISRQRYWGTPIPLIHCDDCGYVQVPESDLPVELPEFIHTRGNPLDAAEEWKHVACPECGADAERETDTMNTFVDSSWYFLRYIAPDETDAPFDTERATDWMPVDEYVGGDEHAVMHLLYARFFTKVLDDMGLLDGIREPFENLTTQGMVLGTDGNKMSKSKGNGVSPQEIVDEYGADTARLFIMEAAQPETEFAWDPEGVASAHQFLQNVYGLIEEYATGRVAVTDGGDPAAAYVEREIDALIEQATEEYEAFRFNHAVRAARELASLLRRYRSVTEPTAETFERGVAALLKLLSPVAPHVTEEAWDRLGNDSLLVETDWPEADVPDDYGIERELVETTREDVRNIIDTVGIENPTRITLTVAESWKHRAHEIARDAGDDVVGAVMSDAELRQRGEEAASFAKDLAPHANALDDQLSPEREQAALERAAWLIEREFDAEVVVLPPEDAPDALRGKAEPGRPGIEIEE